jgi:hypothetical protein
MDYYKQGDAANADQIKAAFKAKGIDTRGYEVNSDYNLYYSSNGLLYFENFSNALLNVFKTNPGYKELELPVGREFKVGDWLAGIDDEGDMATEKIVSFSHNKVLLLDTDGCHTEYPKTELSNFHLWAIADAKDGEVLVSGIDNPFIYDGNIEFSFAGAYIGVSRDGRIRLDMFPSKCWTSIKDVKPATKEQRDLLFAKMKEVGYQWDDDKKELCKIDNPNFKVGDWVVRKDGDTFYGGNYAEQITLIEVDDKGKSIWLSSTSWVFGDVIRPWTIEDARDGDVLAINWHEDGDSWEKIIIFKKYHTKGVKGLLNRPCVQGYGNTFKNGKLAFDEEVPYYSRTWTDKLQPATKEQRDLLFAKMKEAGYEWDDEKKELKKIINPNFKVGDEIKAGNTIETIAEVDYNTRSYYCESGRTIWFENQDLWHLVPKPHYDISNFKAGMPVLVRDGDCDEWKYVSFSHYRKVGTPFCAGGQFHFQCIPFEGNETLLGTTNMPSEEYINW